MNKNTMNCSQSSMAKGVKLISTHERMTRKNYDKGLHDSLFMETEGKKIANEIEKGWINEVHNRESDFHV